MGDQNGDGYAHRAVRGVKGVLEGTLPFFTLQYPCHSPTEQRWFVMNVAPVSGHEFGAVVSHVNISAWYKGQFEQAEQAAASWMKGPSGG